MLKHFVFTFCFLFYINLFAQNSTLILNQKVSAKISGVTKTFEIQAAGQAQTEFEITIQNGNGLDYFQKICTGSALQKVFCKVENLITRVFVLLDRPAILEIKINNDIIANRQSFPAEKGIFTVRRFLQNQQVLSVFAKGLPTASATIKVTKFERVNLPPLAKFDFNSANYVEPSLVSFSALLSTDPDGTIANYSWSFGDQSFATGALAQHIYQTAGAYNVTLTVTDNRGAQNSVSKIITIESDTLGPVLSQLSPPDQSLIDAKSVVLTGESNEALSKVVVQVNSEPAIEATLNQKHFSVSLLFSTHGSKNITITAFDLKNNQSLTTISYNIIYNNPPLAKINVLSQSSGIVPSMIWFDGTTSTDPDGDPLTYLWDFGGNEASTEAKPTHLFKIAGSQTISLTVKDSFGATHSTTKTIILENPVLAADPATVAPPLSPDLIQTNEDKFGFLFTGADAVQKNVDVTKIETERITPLRGKVLKDSATALEAVKVSVKDHPEYGYTLSRNDGMWDLVVNGGGDIIILFEKVGFSSAQRQVDTSNNIPRTIEDLVLVAIDEKKTIVQLGSATAQVHEATISTDQDGVRKAQVVIPENTTASIVMPDGTRTAVGQLTIREKF